MLALITEALAQFSMSSAHKRAAQKDLAREFVDMEMSRFDRHVEEVLHEIELMEKDLFMYCNVEKNIPEKNRIDIEEHMKLHMKNEAVNKILTNGIEKVKSKLDTLKTLQDNK